MHIDRTLSHSQACTEWTLDVFLILPQMYVFSKATQHVSRPSIFHFYLFSLAKSSFVIFIILHILSLVNLHTQVLRYQFNPDSSTPYSSCRPNWFCFNILYQYRCRLSYKLVIFCLFVSYYIDNNIYDIFIIIILILINNYSTGKY